MPYNSAQISGLVGGQMAMFSNQAQFAQQIGGQYGTGPMPQGGGMQNPFPQSMSPSYGLPPSAMYGGNDQMASHMAGGMANMIPAAAGMVSMAAGFMPGPARYLDAFSGVGAAFGHGTGAGAGAGFMSGMGQIGSAFRTGGIGAGLSATGGGLAAGAAAALPYYAAYKGIEFVGSNIAAGVQNFSDTQRIMGQYGGPTFGQAGTSGTGKIPRREIQGMVSTLHDLMSEDMLTTMDSLKRLMDMAGRMGMMSGVTDATAFKDRFGTMVRQVREIAKVMGTSLEEAAPLFGQLKQTGLWRTSDIMGTATAMKAVGPNAAPSMMGAMQTGSQMSFQQGGPLAAGAIMGRNAFMQVQAATKAGIISEQQIQEFTGGTGGAEGQRMMAEQMTGAMSNMANTPMGRLMMAGLGEFKEGRFTGQIDRQMMQRFQSGGVGVNELQSVGQQRTAGREGAVSFSVRGGQIGQQMMAQGGMTAMAASLEAVLEKSGYGGGSEDVQNMIIQKMTGLQAREAEMMRKMVANLPQIMASQGRQVEAAMADSFRRLEIRRNRSWEGLRDSMGYRLSEAFVKPLQQFGESLTGQIGESIDEITEKMLGGPGSTTTSLGTMTATGAREFGSSSLATAERRAKAKGLGGASIDLDTPIAEGLRTGTTRFEQLEALGMKTYRMEGTRDSFWSGSTTGVKMSSAREIVDRMMRRTGATSIEGMGYTTASTADKDIAGRARRIMSDFLMTRSGDLKRLRESSDSEAEFMGKASKLMDPEKLAEMVRLGKQIGGKGSTSDIFLDFARDVQEQELSNASVTKFDFGRVRDDFSSMAHGTPEAARKMQMRGAEIASGVSRGGASTTWGTGLRILSLISPVTAIGGVTSWIMNRNRGEKGLSKVEFAALVREARVDPKDVKEFFDSNGEVGPENSLMREIKKGNKSAGKLGDLKGVLSQSDVAEMVSGMELTAVGAVSESSTVADESVKKLATQEMAQLDRLRGKVSDKIQGQYKSMLEAYGRGDLDVGRQRSAELSRMIAGDEKAQQAILGAGGVLGGESALITRTRGLAAEGQMSESQFRQWIQKKGLKGVLGAMQAGGFGEKLSEMMKGGLDHGELRTIEKEMRKTLKQPGATAMAGGTAGGQADTELSYKEANERFVFAVSDAIVSMGGKISGDYTRPLTRGSQTGSAPIESSPGDVAGSGW